MDIPGFWFEPLLILRFRQELQKSKFDEEFWAWHFARRISIYLTLLLSRTAITPNQVTVVGILTGVIGAALWGAGTDRGFLMGSVCLQVMYILDCADGELARIKNLKSPTGAYLDLLGHYLVDYCMIMGIGIGLSHTFGEVMNYLAVGLVIIYLGDELLRDVLLKAQLKSGKLTDLDALHKTFSLSNSFTPLVRAIGSVVGSPAFFTGVLFFSLADKAMGGHYGKLTFFLLWGFANTLRFTLRFRRILRTAFREHMLAEVRDESKEPKVERN